MSKTELTENCLAFGLTRIADELNHKNIEFFAFFGTLLGLVRGSKPIANDDDVDFYVRVSDYENVKSLLSDLSFEIDYETWPNHTKHFIQALGLLEGVFVRVDFYFYDEDVDQHHLIEKWNFMGQIDNPKSAIRVPKPLVFPLSEMSFNGVAIPIPKYPELMCEFLYGVNWRIPQKKGVDYGILMLGGRPLRVRQKDGKTELLA